MKRLINRMFFPKGTWLGSRCSGYGCLPGLQYGGHNLGWFRAYLRKICYDHICHGCDDCKSKNIKW